MRLFLILGAVISMALVVSCGAPANAQNGDSYTDLELVDFLAKAKADKNAVILDVRTPGETADGIIPGAVELDYRGDDFTQKVNALDKSKTYYIYCRSGGRSVSACEAMGEAGFKGLYNLLGGYQAYESAQKK